jgi:heme A synthase
MKPKIQMRIGLWGVISFTVFGVYQFICHLLSDSLPELLGMLTSLIIFVIYIFSIIRKKLKTAQKAFRVWRLLWVVSLGLMSIGFLGLCSREKLLLVLLILLCCGVFFGILTLIMWMGLRGLERVIESESRSNEEITSTTEKAGEK